MKHPLKIISELKKAKTAKRVRSIIEKEWKSDNDQFLVGIQLALDPNLNVKKVPKWDNEDDSIGSITMEEFYKETDKIKHGANPDPIIKSLAEKAGSNEWNNWYRKILTKEIIEELPMDHIVTALMELTSPKKGDI